MKPAEVPGREPLEEAGPELSPRRKSSSFAAGQISPALSGKDPDPTQEVNVRVLWLSPLSEFSFSFLKHWAFSFHCHPTHSSPLSPCCPPGLAISAVILCLFSCPSA